MARARYLLADALLGVVKEWRQNGYPGVTEPTHKLLDFWFETDHQGQVSFWDCQREAIETLIYLREVKQPPEAKIGALAEALQVERAELFGITVPDFGRQLRLLDDWRAQVDYRINTYDPFPKYAFRMATGSGKTIVMAMTMVWMALNGYSHHFLLLAPNLIVFERLKLGFEGDAETPSVFRQFPLVPTEHRADFLPTIGTQDDFAPPAGTVTIHITNIQQLYNKPDDSAPTALQPFLEGFSEQLDELAPAQQGDDTYHNTLLHRLAQYPDLVVFNDEAHHVHDADLMWAKAIQRLSEDGHLLMQLDFSATPKDPQGQPFPHVIYNYPLNRAIRDGIVKRVRIGTLENVDTALGADTWLAEHKLAIDEGVRKRQEYCDSLAETEAHPVLFVMADDTRHADEVASYLEQTYEELRGRILVIHTGIGKQTGEILKKDLELARSAARQIDRPDSPYDVIVSVLMLKEGWDVRNVTVIVPLRKADAPILVEQTLGRGLRRVFSPGQSIDEVLTVVEHPRFRLFWQMEIEDDELEIEIVSVREKPPAAPQIHALPERATYDIPLPLLSGGVTRQAAPDWALIDVAGFVSANLHLADIPPRYTWVERDLNKGGEQKVDREKMLSPVYAVALGRLTRYLADWAGLPGTTLVPLAQVVHDYIQAGKLFVDVPFDATNAALIKVLQSDAVVECLAEIIPPPLDRARVKVAPFQTVVRLYSLLNTPAWSTTQPLYRTQKSVFDALPYPVRGGELEKAFMHYLDDQLEVEAWVKIGGPIPLKLPYLDAGRVRHYIPDFVVRTSKRIYLVESKGTGFARMGDVPEKIEVACAWCARVSALTGQSWEYRFMQSKAFNPALSFEALMARCNPCPPVGEVTSG